MQQASAHLARACHLHGNHQPLLTMGSGSGAGHLQLLGSCWAVGTVVLAARPVPTPAAGAANWGTGWLIRLALAERRRATAAGQRPGLLCLPSSDCRLAGSEPLRIALPTISRLPAPANSNSDAQSDILPGWLTPLQPANCTSLPRPMVQPSLHQIGHMC